MLESGPNSLKPLPEKHWTIKKVLQWATDYLAQKGFPSSRLDAELLLAESLQCQRLQLYLDMQRPLVPAELASFRELLKRRAAHEPVAYIRGTCEFWSLPFKVTPAVLIPRPETECLIEEAKKFLITDKPLKIVDLGTGSGCIAVALAKEFPLAQVWASEQSSEALAVAQENVKQLHNEGRIHLVQGDLFAPLETQQDFDLIVSNPPYIALSEKPTLMRDVKDFEPEAALFSGDDGLSHLQKIIAQAPRYLAPQGYLLLEFAPPQAPRLRELAQQAGFTSIQVHKDYARQDRVFLAQ